VKTSALLLVENEPAIHVVVRMILENHGYAVTSAYTAAQAREELAGGRPAAALINLVLPDDNGLSLCREIRADERWSDIPVMILCGRCRRGDRDRAQLAGADAFETLPFDERTVLEWLGQQELQGAGGGIA
jgi:DNA-binding response OmpR family regulator